MLSLVLSCNSDDYSEEVQLTEADLFVASPQFQKLSKETSLFQDKVTNAYRKLSKEEQKEFDEINSEISKGQATTEETGILMAKLGSIIKMDYKGGVEKITNLALETYKDQKVSTKDFLIAMEKRSIRNENPIARIKTRSESGDPERKAYDDCCARCEDMIQERLGTCTKNYLQNRNLDEHMRCCSAVAAGGNTCRADCIKFLQ